MYNETWGLVNTAVRRHEIQYQKIDCKRLAVIGRNNRYSNHLGNTFFVPRDKTHVRTNSNIIALDCQHTFTCITLVAVKPDKRPFR